MRKLITILFILFLLSSCVGDPTDVAGRPLTIFGRLSQVVQLGSTQETIGYKMQSDTLFVTGEGEVLMNRPAYVLLNVTDQASGERVEDLTISMVMCQAVDEEIDWYASCDPTVAGGIYRYDLTAVDNGSTYVVEGFEWDRPGGWYFETTIQKPDGSEPELLTFSSEIYPQRPPSSNAFELTNISLPFIVIAIFLGLLRLRGGQLMQSAPQKEHSF
ncbi:MAG: hypothetical protein AAF490_10605 [Chloroflexota bacterium]